MYTILLVDDETTVLDALKSEINWEEFGINTVLTAVDGISALQILETHTVNLLITDICMPRMDGLELLVQVRELYPEIHCILLTAYSEFEYARKALLLGVENYLLKPFQHDELEKTIEKALDNIYADHQNTNHLFRNNILSRWVNNNISDEELSERAFLLDVNIYLDTYCIVCIRKRDANVSVSAFEHSFKKVVHPQLDIYSFWDESGRFVMILGGSTVDSNRLTQQLNRLASTPAYKDSLLIAIGSIAEGNTAVWKSYQSACMLLDTGVPVSSSGILPPRETNALSDNTLISQLLTIFQQTDSEQRINSYRQLIHNFFGENSDMLLAQLPQSLYRLFEQEFPNQPVIKKEAYNRICLFSVTPNNNTESAILDLLEYIYLIFRYNFNQLSPVIQHAISYIHKNFADGLSIKEFCIKSKMSTAYFGYLFKKETGMFFNNYVLQYRICCSLVLLQNTDLQINDIAKKVGFSSNSYFISCFKKQVGMSPNKYKLLKISI